MTTILKHIRAFFWFIHICSWNWWKVSLKHGPRIQVFRNRRYPKGYKNARGEDIGGERVYTCYRWGFAILGLEIGDRGHAREHVRRQMGLAS